MTEKDTGDISMEFQPEEWPSADLKEPFTLRVIEGANLPEDVLEQRVSAILPDMQNFLDHTARLGLDSSEVIFFPLEMIPGLKPFPPSPEEPSP